MFSRLELSYDHPRKDGFTLVELLSERSMLWVVVLEEK